MAAVLSLEAGAVNYGGSGAKTSTGVLSDVSVTPIQTVGNILPLDQDIQKTENQIKELYMTNPLGKPEDFGTHRSASEVQARLNAMRQKYALSFEIIERELLSVSLLIPMRILIKQNKIEIETENLDLTKITYQNALAQSAGKQDVDTITQYVQTTQLIAQSATALGLYPEKTIRYVQDSLGIPLHLRMTEAEVKEYQAQIQMQQQQAQQGLQNQVAAQQQSLQARDIVNSQQPMTE